MPIRHFPCFGLSLVLALTAGSLAAEDPAPPVAALETKQAVSEKPMPPTSTGASLSELGTPDPTLQKIQKQASRLSAEERLSAAKLAEELRAAKEEIQRLGTEVQLMQARQKKQLAEWELEKQRIAAEQSLAEARRQAKLADLERLKAENRAEIEKLQQQKAIELAVMEEEAKQIQAKLTLQNARESQALAELTAQNKKLMAEIQLKTTQMKLKDLALRETALENQEAIAKMSADIALREKRHEWANEIDGAIAYEKKPFKDGVLTVTDRRIALNGPIVYGVADRVSERIHFFNNQSSEAPIFIIIDRSPGGSVMEGYRILKAMEASRAPVHVVVKSFAASMAAVITTLADHSYAYPNAIVLHHQISGGMRGNLTQQKEWLETMKEWSRRLMDPVAKKMGITTEQFVERMYKRTSSGDWEEFADVAQQLKWVDHIVREVREVSYTKRPSQNESQAPRFFFMAEEQKDAEGHPFVQLPRLNPFDAYAIYSPDRYYR